MSIHSSFFDLRADRLHIWRALFLVLVSVVSGRVVLAQDQQSAFAPQVVVVQFEPGTVKGERAAKTGLTAFDHTVARYQVEVIERAFPFLDYVEPTPKTAQNLVALRSTYYVRYRTETDPERVARALSAVRGVVYAEPLLINRVFEPEPAFINHVLEPEPPTDPNDSLYGDQTYLQHMRLPEAWDLVKGEDGTPPVVIAIVDSGTEWDHEDLLANVWTNEDEISGNGIDDDANGFIDDVHGANFANENDMDNDPKPLPGSDHGTLVAGTASAVTDNATGLAGAAWNAELMHVNVDCQDRIDVCHGYEGILYAAVNGADIINASWGGFSGDQESQMIAQTLDLVTDMGALVVAAAGNENINNDAFPIFPAAHPRVLSVGATEKDSRRRAGFSQYGKTVNVFAPGVEIITTSLGNGYDFLANGTSFSSPLVSGVAALIKTRFPEISPDALREQLRLSSDNMDAENPGFAGQLGRGYVNAEASLQAPTIPGVRVKHWSWSDADGDGRIDSGDHITVVATVVNHLSAARSLTVELVAAESYPFITMTASEYQVGSLERGDSTKVTFQFEIAADASPNVSARFYARISDGAFTDEVDMFHFGINRRPDLVHASLSALYVATDGDNWTDNTGWDITMVPMEEEFSDWYGIGTVMGRFVVLDLSDNNLTGTLPVEWSGLSELEFLWLYYNLLSGPIPAELGQLSKLRVLDLDGNLLTGEIPPELSQLSQLQELWLNDNSLSGPIPAELGQLSQLQWLWLNNNLLSGPIPAELGQLSQLEVLFLEDNSLSGPIPVELGQLSALQELWLNNNSLSGPIPAELEQLTELRTLYLSGNSLSGPIPAELGHLSQLQTLLLEDNTLSGPISANLGQLSELQELWLADNLLSGPIPAELGQLSELQALTLDGNSLTGQLPRSFMQLDNLQFFEFGGQDLCAPADDEFQAWLRSIPYVSGPTCGDVAPVSFTVRIADQSFPHAQAIAPIILPEATGGIPPIVYDLTPVLPTGLTFDANTRTISGTPTVVTASMPFTYKATGGGGSSASLEFNIEVVSPVHVENEALPEVFAIRGNYPNPFRDVTRLVVDLPWPARVAVEVLDVTGRRVLAMPAIELSAGWERSLEMRDVGLSSGLYLYRLIATSSEGTTSMHVGRFVQIR